MTCNKNYQKSSSRTYNATTQTLTAAVTPLTLIGAQCTDTGCAVDVNGANITINKSGLYYLEADVTFTPTAAGTEIIQLYKDGVALPCAISQTTATVGTVFTTRVETVLNVNACCAIHPVFTVRASGTAGAANFVGATVVKLA